MRELKFRAWTGNKMVFGPTDDNRSPTWVLSFCECGLSERCNLMQYIGFADNNGVDIYEGDIISLDVESESASDPTKTEPDWILAEVRWNHAGFVAWIKADDGDVTCDIPHDTLVMGNIHENPELLES